VVAASPTAAAAVMRRDRSTAVAPALAGRRRISRWGGAGACGAGRRRISRGSCGDGGAGGGVAAIDEIAHCPRRAVLT
jgi:hypothetical protein